MISMPKHTPGPFVVDNDCMVYGGQPYARLADCTVADGDKLPVAQAIANAHLFSVAPKLLRALKFAERFMRGFEDDESQKLKARLSYMRAAIAEAEGR